MRENNASASAVAEYSQGPAQPWLLQWTGHGNAAAIPAARTAAEASTGSMSTDPWELQLMPRCRQELIGLHYLSEARTGAPFCRRGK